MNENKINIQDKIRQQYETGPYPRIPLEASPKHDIAKLYIHNLTTANYRRNRQVVMSSGKLILDAACGSGFTTLCLAEANPGAKIVGIDISEESVKLARERLKYHGFDQVNFYCISLEDLPSLGMQFDYINADEVLYLLPNIIKGLEYLKAVLKAEGIIRTNLHSYLQRFPYYRSQSLFEMMGLMEGNPEEMEVEIVKEFFKSLKNSVSLKINCWRSKLEEQQEYYMMNFFLLGDKGYTITELFQFLEASNLEFISMVNWRKWDLLTLFEDPENLPAFLALTLPEASIEEQLRMYELIHPVNRLLDFWSGHPQSNDPVYPPEEWARNEWQTVTVYLHPQLKTEEMKNALFESIKNLQPLDLGKYWPIIRQEILIDNSLAACILPPLLDSPQSLDFLVKRWQTLHPVDPLTLEPTTDEEVFTIIRQFLINQEALDYILLERRD